MIRMMNLKHEEQKRIDPDDIRNEYSWFKKDPTDEELVEILNFFSSFYYFELVED